MYGNSNNNYQVMWDDVNKTKRLWFTFNDDDITEICLFRDNNGMIHEHYSIHNNGYVLDLGDPDLITPLCFITFMYKVHDLSVDGGYRISSVKTKNLEFEEGKMLLSDILDNNIKSIVQFL